MGFVGRAESVVAPYEFYVICCSIAICSHYMPEACPYRWVAFFAGFTVVGPTVFLLIHRNTTFKKDYCGSVEKNAGHGAGERGMSGILGDVWVMWLILRPLLS